MSKLIIVGLIIAIAGIMTIVTTNVIVSASPPAAANAQTVLLAGNLAGTAEPIIGLLAMGIGIKTKK